MTNWVQYFESAKKLQKRSFMVANFSPGNGEGARNMFKEDEKELRELAAKYNYEVTFNKHHALFLNTTYPNLYLKS